ncbi:MAG: 1-acyl-sn-glycerol-3-phosphate acyltransferase [Clostridia bacterium]|nr:1-acyl-sn-glycerol-3-phosphate acyltransferase [Clostridia bacterium]
MIIGDNREAVIENIKVAAENGDFHSKVEINDPNLTPEQSKAILDRYVQNRRKASFKAKTLLARQAANLLTFALNRNSEITGIENALGIKGGAIVTSNHFSPVENTAVRLVVKKLGKKRINIVSQETNLAMPGAIGFLMNYADIIPIAEDKNYLKNNFPEIIKSLIQKNEYVLIYPEQEMWFNYRKPRPFKRGAYYYAAKLGVPVISIFVEMQDLNEKDTDEFNKVKFKIHILKTLYPDPEKSVKENSVSMCEEDYAQKKAAYEKAYGKPLDYTFQNSDIAGWVKK